MTIALALTINDGVVLASDSASTLFGSDVDSNGQLIVAQVYNNANKIFNLCKGLPIGAITWGSGSIGPLSVSLLTKDLRERFAGRDPEYLHWTLNPKKYTIKEVAEKLRTFIFDEHYNQHFKESKPPLGFMVAGYSAAERLPEVYLIEIAHDGTLIGPEKQNDTLIPKGMPDAICRLVLGFDSRLEQALRAINVAEEQISQAIAAFAQFTWTPLVYSAMPLQDAIELSEFLVELTIKYSRFLLGAKMVGGPIEISAISKYEGFKWIKRKHYYDEALNPKDTYEKTEQHKPRRAIRKQSKPG